jgi:hypothetical protein
MTNNQFYFWIAQHENGRYSKAHAHTSAAVLICLKGKGYTYSGPMGWADALKNGNTDEIMRLDYGPFGIVTAAPGGARWYHQHFSVSKTHSGLARGLGPTIRQIQAPLAPHTDYPAIDLDKGGTAIPYWMEDPYCARNSKRRWAQQRRMSHGSEMVRRAKQSLRRLRHRGVGTQIFGGGCLTGGKEPDVSPATPVVALTGTFSRPNSISAG